MHNNATTKVDIIILGQGLSGTFLSYYLTKAGKKVLVIDENRNNTASKVASGVINPVTGRRIVRTWRIEELLPFARQSYTELGQELGVSVLNETAVLDFHPSNQMKEAFDKRLGEKEEYLHAVAEDWSRYFNYIYGIGKISPCLLVNINAILTNWRAVLEADESLLEEQFDHELLTVADKVSYKNYEADTLVFCDGVAGQENRYFHNLPFAFNKGEALILEINDLPHDYIYKQGTSIVPWQDGLFWVGSSYQWDFDDDKPTEIFRQRIVNQLKFWLRSDFKVLDHLASVRPANIERRPFVGLHPNFPNIGILNGMGTKGCSLAPFFAKQFADHITAGSPIYPDADVKRFERVLNRNT